MTNGSGGSGEDNRDGRNADDMCRKWNFGHNFNNLG